MGMVLAKIELSQILVKNNFVIPAASQREVSVRCWDILNTGGSSLTDVSQTEMVSCRALMAAQRGPIAMIHHERGIAHHGRVPNGEKSMPYLKRGKLS